MTDPLDDEDACACGDQPAPSCAPKLALSVEEEQVLGRMRAVRDEARALKARIAAAVGQERDRLRDELEDARQRFRALKVELKQANRIKLIRLGHRP
jgi:hypothetical protein